MQRWADWICQPVNDNKRRWRGSLCLGRHKTHAAAHLPAAGAQGKGFRAEAQRGDSVNQSVRQQGKPRRVRFAVTLCVLWCSAAASWRRFAII